MSRKIPPEKVVPFVEVAFGPRWRAPFGRDMGIAPPNITTMCNNGFYPEAYAALRFAAECPLKYWPDGIMPEMKALRQKQMQASLAVE